VMAADKFDKNDKITTFVLVFMGRINQII